MPKGETAAKLRATLKLAKKHVYVNTAIRMKHGYHLLTALKPTSFPSIVDSIQAFQKFVLTLLILFKHRPGINFQGLAN
jgi:hypothetical protein